MLAIVSYLGGMIDYFQLEQSTVYTDWFGWRYQVNIVTNGGENTVNTAADLKIVYWFLGLVLIFGVGFAIWSKWRDHRYR